MYVYIYIYTYTQSTTSVYQFTLFGVPACSWRLCMTCSNLMNLNRSSNFKSLHVLNILKPHGTKPQENMDLERLLTLGSGKWEMRSSTSQHKMGRTAGYSNWSIPIIVDNFNRNMLGPSRNISEAKCIPKPNQWIFAVFYLLNLQLQTNNLIWCRDLSPLPGRSFWIGLAQGKHVGVWWWMYKNAKVPIVRWLPSLMNH